VRKLEQGAGHDLSQGGARVVEGHKEKLVVTREEIKEFLGASRYAWQRKWRSGMKAPAEGLIGLGRTPREARHSVHVKPTR